MGDHGSQHLDMCVEVWACLLVFHGDLGGSCSAFLLIALYSAGTQ